MNLSVFGWLANRYRLFPSLLLLLLLLFIPVIPLLSLSFLSPHLLLGEKNKSGVNFLTLQTYLLLFSERSEAKKNRKRASFCLSH